ncbi:hypothetical protein WAB17_08145 [Parerythrobacter aurantius]|uniref:hypothetical protein n=1 Tax=Parerythrobacter aurantius TaxID=3127706 RepID=UPI00324EE492
MPDRAISEFEAQFPFPEIAEFELPPAYDIQFPDRWVASSLLQKAIRRGEADQAISAARYLCGGSLVGVFRRLNIIAWEDVSFGDIQGCLAVASLGSSARLRAKLGGDEHCLAWAISRLAAAAKCRVTDDLVTILEHGGSSSEYIASVASRSEEELRSLAWAPDRCQLRRTIAVWLLVGTDRFPSEAMPQRNGSADRFFEQSTADGMPTSLRKDGAKLCRSTNTIFPAVVAALWEEWEQAQAVRQVGERLAWTELVEGLPAYVFDGHTAKGSRYLSRLAGLDSELAWWLCSNLPAELHKPALKKFCFRMVSAQCNQRHSWQPAEEARARAGTVGFRLPQDIFLEGLLIFSAVSAKYPIWEIG